MEFKGTKGKWEVVDKSKLESTIISNGKRISDVKSFGIETEYKGIKHTDPTTEEKNYNALLISKAPELLKMLESVLKDNYNHSDKMREIQQLIEEATKID